MNIFNNKKFIVLLSLSGVFLLTAIISILVNRSDLYYPVIMYVTDNDGVNNLGSILDVWRIVIIGGALILMNSMFSEIIFNKKRLLSYLLMISSFVVSLLVLILVLYIISLN